MPELADDRSRYDEVIDAYGTYSAPLYVGGPGSQRHAGRAWFALVSGQASGELNVCAIGPGASTDAAERIVAALHDLPAIVSVAPRADSAAAPALTAAGFERADTAEPIMFCQRLPAARETSFRVTVASRGDFPRVVEVISASHGVASTMVDGAVGRALRDGEGQAWVAWDGDEPVSTVVITPSDRFIGVNEMMTPPRHRRRGGGRAVLAAALADAWRDTTRGAYLLSTPAGRPLYEAFGFQALAESMTWVRGGDPAVLAAIGNIVS